MPQKQPRTSSLPQKQPRTSSLPQKQPRTSSARHKKKPRTPSRQKPSPVAPVRSPTLASPPSRRDSFSATDVFMSPIEWSKAPGHGRDAADVARILAKGAVMCRGDISARYIQRALADPGVAIWVIRDSHTRIFGFALTKEHATHVELVLICTHKRKGEGMQLFTDILEYSSVHGTEVRLEAVTGDVANKYAVAARARGFGVFAHGRALVTAVDPHDAMIPMTLRPPGRRLPLRR